MYTIAPMMLSDGHGGDHLVDPVDGAAHGLVSSQLLTIRFAIIMLSGDLLFVVEARFAMYRLIMSLGG
jgi:hypothetical protein